MAELTRLPGTTSLDEVIAVIERDGGVIVQDFVPPSIIAELKADLLPGLGACSTGRDDFSGVRTRRMSALFAKSRRVADLVIHPLFLGAAEHFVDRLKSYPEQIQRLLGWSYMPETYMGWVEIDGEMADPIRLLAGDAPGNDASRELLPPAGRDDR
jgi:hypothetical protein